MMVHGKSAHGAKVHASRNIFVPPLPAGLVYVATELVQVLNIS